MHPNDIELDAKAREVVSGGRQSDDAHRWVLGNESGWAENVVEARLDVLRVAFNGVVVTTLEVVDEQSPRSKRATRHIEQSVLRAESFTFQEVQLQAAHF